MNTNTAVIGGVVVALLLTGGIFIYANQGVQSPSGIATSTPSGTDQTDTTDSVKTPAAPIATTNSNVTPSNTTAVVVGGVTPNGALTTYWYEYGASANLGITSDTQTIGSGYATLAAPAYITGLAKDTPYYYRLVAQNSIGKSTGATYTFRTAINNPAPVGSAPTAKTLSATTLSRTGATINGQVTPNKASTQYWFEWGTTANLGNVSTLQSVGNGSAAASVSLPLSNLAPSTTYYYRLNAQNQFGTANGTILTFKTSGPALSAAPVVTTQVASPVGATTATVRGTVNPGDAQTTYWFEYSSDSLLGSVLLKTTTKHTVAARADTASVQAALSSLNRNTTYYYRTVAQNSAGTTRGERMSFKTN